METEYPPLHQWYQISLIAPEGANRFLMELTAEQFKLLQLIEDISEIKWDKDKSTPVFNICKV